MTEFDRKEGDNDVQDTTWSAILRQVDESSQSEGPWYKKLGVLLAWSAGIALGVGIATILILAIVDLFSPARMLNARTMSDWLFYAAALVLFSGLLAPTAQDMERSTRERQQKDRFRASSSQRASTVRQEAEDRRSLMDRLDERRERAVRRRLMRVYNPWQWRLWLSAILCFGLAILAGVFA